MAKTEAQKTKNAPLIIAPQTKIVFVAFVLIVITKLILFARTDIVTASPMTIFTFVYFVMVGILGLYVTNCTVLGSCNLFAWIMAYVYLTVGFLIAMGAMLTLF